MINNGDAQSGGVDRKIKTSAIENPRSQAGRPVEGVITKQIGSGEYAKDTFIYITIRWSFTIGCAMSVALYLRSYFGDADVMEDMKGVWSIFMPVITLALGYSFGKGR